MSRYLRTAPEYRELGAWRGETAIGAVSDEEKALLAVGAVSLAMTAVKWSIIGFVSYKLIKAVSK